MRCLGGSPNTDTNMPLGAIFLWPCIDKLIGCQQKRFGYVEGLNNLRLGICFGY